MSETVKIVVELSKGQYEHLKDTQYGGIGARMIFNKVVNGKPLSEVLDEIKGEIAEEICLTDNPYTKETKYTIEHLKLLEIIDKHIGREGEE